VEEIGRTRPATVAELMEEANRFADGEDAYNNKRGCSPEFDRASRQKVMRELSSNLSRRENITDTKFNVAMEAICKVGKQLTDVAMDLRDKKPVDRRGKLLLLYILADIS
jgi:hypothetical protein